MVDLTSFSKAPSKLSHNSRVGKHGNPRALVIGKLFTPQAAVYLQQTIFPTLFLNTSPISLIYFFNFYFLLFFFFFDVRESVNTGKRKNN